MHPSLQNLTSHIAAASMATSCFFWSDEGNSRICLSQRSPFQSQKTSSWLKQWTVLIGSESGYRTTKRHWRFMNWCSMIRLTLENQMSGRLFTAVKLGEYRNYRFTADLIARLLWRREMIRHPLCSKILKLKIRVNMHFNQRLHRTSRPPRWASGRPVPAYQE